MKGAIGTPMTTVSFGASQRSLKKEMTVFWEIKGNEGARIHALSMIKENSDAKRAELHGHEHQFSFALVDIKTRDIHRYAPLTYADAKKRNKEIVPLGMQWTRCEAK